MSSARNNDANRGEQGIAHLQHEVAVLTEERDMLLRAAEDATLLLSISEQLEAAENGDAVTRIVIHQVGLLKALPWCAFVTHENSKAIVTHEFTLNGLPDETRPGRTASLDPETGTKDDWVKRLVPPSLQADVHAAVPLAVRASATLIGYLVVGDHSAETLDSSMATLERMRGIMESRLDSLAMMAEIRALNRSLRTAIVRQSSSQPNAVAPDERSGDFPRDRLTGLNGRESLIAAISDVSILPLDESSPTLLFVLDVDRFTWVNETMGPSGGDALLAEIARRLRSSVRPNDYVARMGGDEFAVLLVGLDSREAVDAVAERVRSHVEVPYELDGRTVHVTVSGGVAEMDPDTRPEELVQRATVAMSRVKESGGRRFGFYDPKLHEQSIYRHVLGSELQGAETRGELELYYQPIVRLTDRSLAGFEALIRWNHPRNGLLPPSDFLEMAERTLQIVRIGRWCLATACAQLAKWCRLDDHHDLTVAVNVSPNQLAHDDLREAAATALAAAELDPWRLHVEITESALMEDNQAVQRTLAGIRALGASIHLDDFGTGFSSLSHLLRYPIDSIKVDRSFVSQMESSHEASQIVRAVLSLADSLSLEVVAEGVEIDSQASRLRDLKCGLAQGYLFGRPMIAAEAESLLRTARSWGEAET